MILGSPGFTSAQSLPPPSPHPSICLGHLDLAYRAPPRRLGRREDNIYQKTLLTVEDNIERCRFSSTLKCQSGKLGFRAKAGLGQFFPRQDIPRTDIPPGLNLDVFTNILNKTALNPALTLPLLLLSYYTRKGQDLAFIHPTALRRLKYLIYIGLARWANAYLSRNVLNNWTTSKYEWSKEIAVITGGSDGIGKHLALLLAEQKTKVIVLDIQPLTFTPRTSPPPLPPHS